MLYMCAHVTNDPYCFAVIVHVICPSSWDVASQSRHPLKLPYNDSYVHWDCSKLDVKLQFRALLRIDCTRCHPNKPLLTHLSKLWSLWKVWFSGKECFVLNLKGHTVSTLSHLQYSGWCPSESPCSCVKWAHGSNPRRPLWLGARHLAESHITYSWHVHLQTQVDKK